MLLDVLKSHLLQNTLIGWASDSKDCFVLEIRSYKDVGKSNLMHDQVSAMSLVVGDQVSNSDDENLVKMAREIAHDNQIIWEVRIDDQRLGLHHATG